MKLPRCLLLSALLATPLVAAPTVTQLWQTEPNLKVPEGVLFDAERQILYVSNIDGSEPWAKDGAGSIARVGLDGSIKEVEWVKGLHAPKGMALAGGQLFVADVDRVVVIDPKTAAIKRTIAVPDAVRLNDVSAGRDGVVYVTDSGAGRLYAIRDGAVTVASAAFKAPNGVLATADGLYVLDQETLFQVSGDGQAKPVIKGLAGHVDGVEQVEPGAFIVSCWNGIVYHATTDGAVTTLVDTRSDEVNAADIGYDSKKRIIYVPTFWKNTVVAYQLAGD